jgi:hypothetical protein
LHAERFANQIGEQPTSIRFKVTWSGLNGRSLKSWASQRFLLDVYQSTQDSVSSEVEISSERISAYLPEIVNELTQPLYEVFDFFKAPMQMIQQELTKMAKLQY